MHIPGLAWRVEECLLAGPLGSLKLLQLWVSEFWVRRETFFFPERAWDIDLGLSRRDPCPREVGTQLWPALHRLSGDRQETKGGMRIEFGRQGILHVVLADVRLSGP